MLCLVLLIFNFNIIVKVPIIRHVMAEKTEHNNILPTLNKINLYIMTVFFHKTRLFNMNRKLLCNKYITFKGSVNGSISGNIDRTLQR